MVLVCCLWIDIATGVGYDGNNCRKGKTVRHIFYSHAAHASFKLVSESYWDRGRASGMLLTFFDDYCNSTAPGVFFSLGDLICLY